MRGAVVVFHGSTVEGQAKVGGIGRENGRLQTTGVADLYPGKPENIPNHKTPGQGKGPAAWYGKSERSLRTGGHAPVRSHAINGFARDAKRARERNVKAHKREKFPRIAKDKRLAA